MFDDFEITQEFEGQGERTMLLDGRRLAGAAGESDLILLAIEDVTRRRQGEQAVQQASNRFRLLTETAPQKIFTANRSGDVDYFNPQWIS